MAKSYPNGYKTLCEKEKLLVTSNFSFSHSVFKRLVSQGRQKVSLSGNGVSQEGLSNCLTTDCRIVLQPIVELSYDRLSNCLTTDYRIVLRPIVELSYDRLSNCLTTDYRIVLRPTVELSYDRLKIHSILHST